MATLRRVDFRWQQCYRSAIASLLILALGALAHAQSNGNGQAPTRSGTLASALLSSQGKVNVPKKTTAPAVRSPVTNPPPGAASLPRQAANVQQPVHAPGPAARSWPSADASRYPSLPPGSFQNPGEASSFAPTQSASEGSAGYSRQPSVVAAQPMRQPGAAVVSSTFRADARLNDVFFVDTQCGWVVGDRGTICHTNDGGGTWHLQASGVDCPLYSVHFFNREAGWAVGGYTHPFTHTGTGIVLITTDGGRTWKSEQQSLLPVLKKVRFFDSKRGWAVGCSSAASPSGLFHTETGGRSWNPVPGGKQHGWANGDFLDAKTGALIGQDGLAAEVRSGRISASQTPQFGLRSPQAVQLVPPHYGWLVGEGGLAMLTRDLGHTWQTPQAPLPAGAAVQFDFHGVSVRNTKVWITGSPGTRVFYTPDAGLSWQTFNTRQSAPLRAIHFADDLHGWAVGELGTILATEDGGQSWRRQRAGGTRAALMGIFADGQDLPLELIAKLSGNEGYLSVAEIIGRPDPARAREEGVPRADRVHEAVVALGGCGAQQAWRFPLMPEALKLKAETVIDGWDRVNDGYGAALLEAHLVRQIRTYRPDVLVTHGPSPTGDDPLGELLNHAVMTAVRAAAAPTSYSDQITQAGLEPWTVTRVFTTMPAGLTGTTSVSTAQLATRLGQSLADAASEPRGLIEAEMAPPVDTLGFRLLVDELPDHGGREDFFTGIVLQPGGEARRQLTDLPPGNLDQMRQMAQRRRHTRAILKQAGADSRTGMGLIAQTEEITRGLDDNMAASVLHHMAQTYFTAGEWPMAATMFERLANRHPNHALARSALQWLVHYYASDEAAWRVHGSQRFMAQNTTTKAVDPEKFAQGVTAAMWEAEEAGPFSIHQASAPTVDTAELEDRQQRAAALGQTIERLLPDLYVEPSVRFPLAVSDRKRGYPTQAERYLMVLQRSTTHDDWWACAQGERWMMEPAGIPPKEVLNCAVAPTKPHLDGNLDDAVWQRAKAVRFRNSSPHAPREEPNASPDDPIVTTAKLAYDDGYLYIALRCPLAEGADYSGVHGIRPRDPDLSNRDRVELFLDIDRDFATYYHLTIDHRGYVSESCWGDATWNPTWFVASDEDKKVWTAEAAIPLDQLTGKYPSSRSTWALGLRRIIPGVGFEGWSTTSVDGVRPEEFGYLIFD